MKIRSQDLKRTVVIILRWLGKNHKYTKENIKEILTFTRTFGHLFLYVIVFYILDLFKSGAEKLKRYVKR